MNEPSQQAFGESCWISITQPQRLWLTAEHNKKSRFPAVDAPGTCFSWVCLPARCDHANSKYPPLFLRSIYGTSTQFPVPWLTLWSLLATRIQICVALADRSLTANIVNGLLLTPPELAG